MERVVTHVAMESSGVFWKPVYNLLEGLGLTVLVVNARHIKAVPGRKTEVKDAEWIAELLRHGLVRGSYILTGLSGSCGRRCAIGEALSSSGRKW